MRVRSTTSLFALIAITALFLSWASNPPDAKTGAPGDTGTCAGGGCHGGGSYQGNVDISGIPSSIQAGQTYTVTLTATATSGSPAVGGFQILALNSSNQNVGDMIVTNGGETGTDFFNTREYMEHRGAKPYSGNQVSWTFDWQAPNGPNNAQITFWFVSNLANDNNSPTGDVIVTNTFSGTIFGAPDPLVLSLDGKEDVSCHGGNDGSATVSATGGTPPLTYTWSNGQSGPMATNLSAGNYSVTVSDNAGQSDNLSVTINEPSQLTLDVASQTPLTCVANATVTVAGQGGTPGYSYAWSTGSSGPNEVLSSGDVVTVTVTDNQGCTATLDFAPELDIEPPVASANGGVITCANPSVSLQVSAQSPCGSFTYAWTNPSGNMFSSDPSPVVLLPGAYTVVVTDICNGCTTQATATVTEDVSAPVITLNGTPDSLDCNHQVIEISTADVPGASYAWTTSDGQIAYGANAPVVGVSAGGTYTLVLTDPGNGCTASVSVPVFGWDDPVATLDSVAGVPCHGDTSGYASIVVMDGRSPFTVAWPDGGTGQVRTNLAGGQHWVVITDQNGCSDSLLVVIDEPSALEANIDASGISAQGANDGLAWVNPSGGTPGYSVLWNTGETTDTISGLAPGTYSATVTDANGCTQAKSVVVPAFGCTLEGVVTANMVPCFGDSSGTVVITWMNGIGEVSILWSTGDTTASVTGLPAGTYSVILTDEGNCVFEDTAVITQPAALTVALDSIHHVSMNGGTDGAVFVTTGGGTGNLSYDWMLNGDSGGNTEDLTGAGAGTWVLEITDENGCTTSFTVEIQEPSSLQPTWIRSVRAYPVPVRDWLQVDLPSPGEFRLSILDSRGHTTLTTPGARTHAQLLTQDLPSGNYWLLIRDEQGRQAVLPFVK